MRIVCDKCYKPIGSTDPCSIEDAFGEVICQDCRDNADEIAYERQQEKLMEDGPDTAIQERLDQQLRDAGRGHLVRP
jgi:hypothetical protein